MMQREKISGTRCVECGAVVAGRPVHCTYSRGTKTVTHHGRWRWSCPRCGQSLGCDQCNGRIGSDVVCGLCHVTADGHPVIPLTKDETRLLIELVRHAAPACAITLGRLAFALRVDERALEQTIFSLKQKGIAIEEVGDRFFLRPHDRPAAPPVGEVELLLPFGE